MIDRVQVVLNRKSPNEDLSKRKIESLIGLPVCKVIRNSYSETLAANQRRPDGSGQFSARTGVQDFRCGVVRKANTERKIS